MNKTLKGYMMLLTACFMFGITFPIGKGILESYSVSAYMGLRYGFAAIIMTVIFFKKLKFNDFDAIKKAGILSCVIGLATISEITGLKSIMAMESGLYGSLNVIFIPIMALIFLKEKSSIIKVVSLLISFSGILLINYNGGSLSFSTGAILTILSAAVYAFNVIVMKKILKEDDNIVNISTIQFYIMTLGYMALSFFNGTLNVTSGGLKSLVIIAMLSVFAQVIGYPLFVGAQKYLKPIETSVLSTSTPVFAMILSFLIIGETMGIKSIIGSVLIIAGVLVSNVEFKKKKVGVLNG